jgi:hypothetical protein
MVYLIIVLAVLARFVPHVMNFSPVYGALLFGGAHLNKRDSIWFPAAVLGLSDVILTKLVYHMGVGWTELVQLAAFVVIALIGGSLRGRFTIARLTFACFAGPTAFYLVSNFGVWLGFGMYPPTWEGLIQCYVAGIPFYGRSLTSTFVFAGLLFGIYEFCHRRGDQTHRIEAHTN